MESETAKVAGYSVESVWDLCVAAGKSQYESVYSSNDPATAEAIRPATAADAGMLGVIATIPWKLTYEGTQIPNVWYCNVDGPTETPRVASISVPDH